MKNFADQPISGHGGFTDTDIIVALFVRNNDLVFLWDKVEYITCVKEIICENKFISKKTICFEVKIRKEPICRYKAVYIGNTSINRQLKKIKYYENIGSEYDIILRYTEE